MILFAAFVAGVKMALPSSMERVNNSKYEEINIPVSEGPPLEVGNQLVPISSLDEIGRKAFANCKTLNRYFDIIIKKRFGASFEISVGRVFFF